MGKSYFESPVRTPTALTSLSFRTAAGETLAIPIPRGETTVIEYFQNRMPNGLPEPGFGPGDGSRRRAGGREVYWGKLWALPL
jgi:hypothetical protein